jgi:hypothetical protein
MPIKSLAPFHFAKTQPEKTVFPSSIIPFHSLPFKSNQNKKSVSRRSQMPIIPHDVPDQSTEVAVIHHSLRHRLGEERANGGLGVGRQALQQLLRVQTGVLHQFACGVDDALGHIALQGFGFEGVGDMVEALRCFGVHGGVVSEMC